MHRWFESPPGRYLLAWEQSCLDHAVADAFGFHALQLGLPEFEALRANRMPHRWVLNDAPVAAASLSVVLASDQAALPPTIRAGSSTAATAIVTAANGVAANADRRSLMVVNPRTNTATVWVSCWGAATTAPPSLPVEPGQRLVADGTSVPSGAVSIIAASGSQPVTIVEG